jgi:hypothetical protein
MPQEQLDSIRSSYENSLTYVKRSNYIQCGLPTQVRPSNGGLGLFYFHSNPKRIMAQFKISGVWKNQQNVIADYAFHEVITDGIGRSKRTPKVDAIRLLETSGNTAMTWQWNYRKPGWEDGERVEVVNGFHVSRLLFFTPLSGSKK